VVVGMWEVPIGGDLIVTVDGRPVDSDNALRSALLRKRPGDKLVLTIYRDGSTRKVTVTLGESRAVSL
jgi:putative serine protease PepD